MSSDTQDTALRSNPLFRTSNIFTSKHASMPFSSFLFRALQPLLPLCILSLTYLYLYPLFHGCAFPSPVPSSHHASFNASFLGPGGQQQQVAYSRATIPHLAQFRLLALGDPQLEGDSSLPELNKDGKGIFPSLHPFRTYSPTSLNFQIIRNAFRDFFARDVSKLVEYGQKWIDLLGNDFYLAHIYRTVSKWTEPTHIVVLGDLLGSQWVRDEEFELRSDRFWNRVFKNAERVTDEVILSEEEKQLASEHVEILGEDPNWRTRLITIAGNHDVGYAGDIDEKRIERFERRFGRVNWSIRFSLPPMELELDNSDTSMSANDSIAQPDTPTLRLIILNSMNIDTPALKPTLQGQTYEFMNNAIMTQSPLPASPELRDNTATVLLTHIPLHKRAGVCADAPYFNYFSSGEGNGVKEQNHLSDYASRVGLLEGVFGMSGQGCNAIYHGMGRRGIVLTGHDHVGCDVWHFWNSTMESVDAENGEQGGEMRVKGWDALRFEDAGEIVQQHDAVLHKLPDEDEQLIPGLREVTVRSMMGEFGGNAGLLSGWFDEDLGEWRFEYASCQLGVQHIWWAIHIFAFIVALVTVAAPLAFIVEQRVAASEKRKSISKRQTTSAGEKSHPLDPPLRNRSRRIPKEVLVKRFGKEEAEQIEKEREMIDKDTSR